MVSVIIPTYNREASISASIYSVLNQSYSDLELIIVDDCSTDNTQKLVAEIMKKNSRVSYHKLSNNMGACAARNYGIKLAKGDYIAFQDSDDIWHTDKLFKQITAIEKNCADIVFCAMNHDYGIYPVIPEGFIDRNTLIEESKASTQTLLARKDVFSDTLFDEQLPRWQDYDWIIRASKKHSIYFIKEPLVDVRIGNDSITRNVEKLSITVNYLLAKYASDETISPKIKSSWLAALAKERTLNNQFDLSIFKAMVSIYPSLKNKCKLILAETRLIKFFYKANR